MAADGEGAYVTTPGGNTTAPFIHPFDTAPELLAQRHDAQLPHRLPATPGESAASLESAPVAGRNGSRPIRTTTSRACPSTTIARSTPPASISRCSTEPAAPSPISPRLTRDRVQKKSRCCRIGPTRNRLIEMFGPPMVRHASARRHAAAQLPFVRAGAVPISPRVSRRLPRRRFRKSFPAESGDSSRPTSTNAELLVWKPTRRPTNQFDDRVRSRDIFDGRPDTTARPAACRRSQTDPAVISTSSWSTRSASRIERLARFGPVTT